MGSYQLALFPCFWLKGLEKWNLTVDLHTTLKGPWCDLVSRLLCFSATVSSAATPSSTERKKHTSVFYFFLSLFFNVPNSAQQVKPIAPEKRESQFSVLARRRHETQTVASECIDHIRRRRGTGKKSSWMRYRSVSLSCEVFHFRCSYLPDEYRTESGVALGFFFLSS